MRSFSIGHIAGRTLSMVVSLGLGMLVSVYMWGGWGSQVELARFQRRAKGEPDNLVDARR